MTSTGIDTVRFHKRFDRATIDRLIRPYIRRGSHGKLWFHGALIFVNKERNDEFSFELSLAREASATDDNIELATPETVDQAIRSFEERSELTVRDAKISRLDIALTLRTEYPVASYLDLLTPIRGYNLRPADNGRYLNSKSREITLTLYDKRQERIDKGKLLPGPWSIGHLARFELRCNRHVRRYLKIPPELPSPTLGDLVDNNLFSAAIELFERYTNRLLLLNKVDEVRTKTTIATAESEIMRQYMQTDPEGYRRVRDKILSQSALEDGEKEKIVDESEWDLTLPYRQEVHRAMRSACAQMYRRYPIMMVAAKDVQEMRAQLAKAA